MALRADLADILLGEDDVLGLGAGEHDLVVLLVGLLLVHLASREGEGNQRQDDGQDR